MSTGTNPVDTKSARTEAFSIRENGLIIIECPLPPPQRTNVFRDYNKVSRVLYHRGRVMARYIKFYKVIHYWHNN